MPFEIRERLPSMDCRFGTFAERVFQAVLSRRAILGWGKGKGCDIGYALAASSCEGAYSVDACTVTALDAITAFAIPNPGSSSQNQPVFSGLVALQVALLSGSLSLLRIDKFLFRQSFQPSTSNKLNSCFNRVNAILGAKTKYL